jgi:tetratricopeptide (TPR) repeat protein
MIRATLRLFLASLSIAALLSTGAAAQNDPVADRHFKLGKEAFGKGDLDKAIEHFQRCVETRKDWKEAWYNLGLAHGRKKQHEREIESYQQAVRVDENYVKAWFNLAIAYEDNHQNGKAIECYEKAIKIDPRAVNAIINLGILYVRMDRVDEGIARYLDAIKIDANAVDAHFNLGTAYGKKAAKTEGKDGRDALLRKSNESYKVTLEKNPKHSTAWYNLGTNFEKLGQLDDEIAAYKEALKIRPKYPRALYNLALAFDVKKDSGPALTYWKQYIETSKDVPGEAEYVSEAKRRVESLEKAAQKNQ